MQSCGRENLALVALSTFQGQLHISPFFFPLIMHVLPELLQNADDILPNSTLHEAKVHGRDHNDLQII